MFIGNKIFGKMQMHKCLLYQHRATCLFTHNARYNRWRLHDITRAMLTARVANESSDRTRLIETYLNDRPMRRTSSDQFSCFLHSFMVSKMRVWERGVTVEGGVALQLTDELCWVKASVELLVEGVGWVTIVSRATVHSTAIF